MKKWLSTMTAFAVAVAMGSAATALAQAPKHGGVLNVMQREELPQGLSIHETSTIATVWPASPCFLFENYGCASSRNYTGYCDEGVGKLMDQQSQELDPKKRLALVHQIQRKLTEAGARPTVGWGIDHFAQWPHVKNLVPHNSLYNYGRMQEVWLDR